MTTATKTRKPKRTAEERKAVHAARWKMLDDLANMMALAVETDPATAERVQAVAEASGYTERNAALIVGQCPAATLARSFKAWKEHGRQVKKGEKAVWILASTAKRGGEEQQESNDQESNDESTKAPAKDAPEGAEGEKKQARRFVTVPVFDVSQTEPIPEADDAE